MANKQTRPKGSFSLSWRAMVVCLLTTLGIVALTCFTIVHWTERQILTTDNWLKIVSPLPKNDEVSSALSTYFVDQLFTTRDIENRITNALPDKASFLGPTLADQLQTRLTKRTKSIIESDQFTNVWTYANKAASQRLLAGARDQNPPKNEKVASFKLNLSSFADTVRSLLGGDTSSEQTAAPKDSVNIGVNLKNSVTKIHNYIRAVDFLNGTLGLLALVCLLGGIVFSHNRRRLIMIISMTTVVIALLQLIGVKALRPEILNSIQNVAYRPAAGAVYDSLVTTFHRTAIGLLIISAVVYLMAWLVRPKILNRNKSLRKYWQEFKKTRFYVWLNTTRSFIRRYILSIMGLAILLILLLMAFAFNLNGQNIVRSVLFMILIIELINLVAARPGRVPMKQVG